MSDPESLAAERAQVKEIALFFVFALVVLSLVYMPYVVIESIFHDNLYYLSGPFTSSFRVCRHYPEFGWLEALGRPLAAWTECSLYDSVRSIASISFLRSIVIGELILFVTMVYAFLRRQTASIPIAAVLSLVIGTLPLFQNVVLMTNFENMTTALLSALSYVFLDYGLQLKAEGGERWQWIAPMVISCLVLIVTEYDYPILTLFFAVMFAIRVAWSTLPTWRDVGMVVAVFAVATLFYALFGKIFLPKQFASIAANLPAAYRVQIVSPSAMLRTVRREGWQNLDAVLTGVAYVLNRFHRSGAAMVCAVMLMGPVAAARTEHWRRAAVRFLLMIGCIAAGIAPLLVLPQTYFELRIIGAASAAAAVLTFWSLDQLASLFGRYAARTRVVLALTIGGAVLLTTGYISLAETRGINQEINFVRDTIYASPTLPKRVDVVLRYRSPLGLSGLSRVGADEFFWTSGDFVADIPGLVRLALLARAPSNEANVGVCRIAANANAWTDPSPSCASVTAMGNPIWVTISLPGRPVCTTPGMVIVDLNILAFDNDVNAGHPRTGWVPGGTCAYAQHFTDTSPAVATPNRPAAG